MWPGWAKALGDRGLAETLGFTGSGGTLNGYLKNL
jgi:hypothetical protein